MDFFKKTGVDALAISYGTMHGASKGKDVKLRKEIAVAIRECLNHAVSYTHLDVYKRQGLRSQRTFLEQRLKF